MVFKDLPENDRAVFDGYTAGINAWLKEIRKNPDKLKPKQFIDFGYGVLNPDMFWYSWSKADRVQCLFDALENRDQLSADEVWSLIKMS